MKRRPRNRPSFVAHTRVRRHAIRQRMRRGFPLTPAATRYRHRHKIPLVRKQIREEWQLPAPDPKPPRKERVMAHLAKIKNVVDPNLDAANLRPFN